MQDKRKKNAGLIRGVKRTEFSKISEDGDMINIISATATFFSMEAGEQETTQFVIQAKTAGVLASYKSVNVFAKFASSDSYVEIPAEVSGIGADGYEIWTCSYQFDLMGSDDVDFYSVLLLNDTQYTDNDNGTPYLLPCSSSANCGCEFYNGQTSLNWISNASFGGSGGTLQLAFTLDAPGTEQTVTLYYSTDEGANFTSFPLVMADQYWPYWQPGLDQGGPPVFSPNTKGVAIWTPYGDNGFIPDADVLNFSADATSIIYYFEYSYTSDNNQHTVVDNNYGNNYEESVTQVEVLDAAATFFSEGGGETETIQFWIRARSADFTSPSVTVMAKFTSEETYQPISASLLSEADTGYQIWFASYQLNLQGSGDIVFYAQFGLEDVIYTDNNYGDDYYLPCTSSANSGVATYNSALMLNWISVVNKETSVWTLAYAMKQLGTNQQVTLNYSVDGGTFTALQLTSVNQYFVYWQPGNPVQSPNENNVIVNTPYGNTGPSGGITLPEFNTSLTYYFDWTYENEYGRFSGTDNNYGNNYSVNA